MKIHADKTPQNKSQVAANSLAKQPDTGKSTFQFVVNRPEAITQMALQEIANNIPQVRQLKAYQEMANNSPQAKQFKAYQAMADLRSGQEKHLPRNNTTIQLQEITAAAAEAAMQERGGNFATGVYEILTPWGNDPEETNCHGYTINQEVDHWVYGDQLLAGIGAEASVAVFIRNDQIAHSGRYNGDQFTHFLIGVGIVRSTLALANTAGYDARYNLPGDREALDTFLAQAEAAAGIAEAAAARRNLVERILDHARQIQVAVAKGVTIGDYDALYGDEAHDAFIATNLEEINRVRQVINSEHEGEYEEVN